MNGTGAARVLVPPSRAKCLRLAVLVGATESVERAKKCCDYLTLDVRPGTLKGLGCHEVRGPGRDGST